MLQITLPWVNVTKTHLHIVAKSTKIRRNEEARIANQGRREVVPFFKNRAKIQTPGLVLTNDVNVANTAINRRLLYLLSTGSVRSISPNSCFIKLTRVRCCEISQWFSENILTIGIREVKEEYRILNGCVPASLYKGLSVRP